MTGTPLPMLLAANRKKIYDDLIIESLQFHCIQSLDSSLLSHPNKAKTFSGSLCDTSLQRSGLSFNMKSTNPNSFEYRHALLPKGHCYIQSIIFFIIFTLKHYVYIIFSIASNSSRIQNILNAFCKSFSLYYTFNFL